MKKTASIIILMSLIAGVFVSAGQRPEFCSAGSIVSRANQKNVSLFNTSTIDKMKKADNEDSKDDKKDDDDKQVVVIDAGHQSHANTGKEPIGPGASTTKYKVTGGTSGCATHIPEYKLNLAMAKRLRKELKKRGYKVIMVRTKNDVNISNSERAKIANDADADAFVRIHANAGGSSSQGALTIAPTKNNKYMPAKARKASQVFSQKMLTEFCKATGAKNNGVMYTDTMTGINWCTVPVTIVEMGFMTNAEEDKKMATDSYREKMTQGMANGIDAFLGNK